ncbi:hypothetical protein FHU41_001815 [Psychromicrobium silvestre]|uniref:Uncharacterized protein n=1 Tax=Psychromicrobium silvestre TaxID=1645614 RepID=A0A7Y9LU31_9MICC|nr:hypothetical protein [Psychromicrobium silvestre]
MSKLTRSCHQPKFSITAPLLSLIISTAFLTACTRPADIVLKDFANTIEDTVKHSGTTFPGWKGSNTDGGSIADPKAAAAAMKANWESLGYVIGNIFNGTNRPVPGVQLNTTTPSGMFTHFSPGADKRSWWPRANAPSSWV